jgi:hypothetical protein
MRDRKRMRIMELAVDYDVNNFGFPAHSVGDYHDLYEGYKDVEEHNRSVYKDYIEEEKKRD